MDEIENVTGAPVNDESATTQLDVGIEASETQDSESGEPRLFTQDELDAILAKRLAKERRKIEREVNQRVETPLEAAPRANLDPSQFTTTEAYLDAVATERAREIARADRQAQEQREVLETYSEREETVRDKYDDFQQVAYNPNLPVTNDMAQVIRASEHGPEVLYYLGQNLDLARKISQLSPVMQAKQLGVIEAQITSAPRNAKTTSAPAPINPVASRAAKPKGISTLDPKAAASMSTSDWIAAERQRQMDKLRAGR